MLNLLAWLLAIFQAVLGARVAARLWRTRGGDRVPLATRAPVGRVTAIVPVLNEEGRLADCLAGLAAQAEPLVRVLVVDGGSTDGTETVAQQGAGLDARIQWLERGEAPLGWNGKVWNLAGGEKPADEVDWLLTVDADVVLRPGLVAALVAFAEQRGLDALSVAAQQVVSGRAEALLHPALLTTLVTRFGIPGHVARSPFEAQANGQCFLVRPTALRAIGGVQAVRDSLCEDVTLARLLVERGFRVGFYESEGLLRTRMYASAAEAWRNWPRSLSLRDRFWGWRGWLGLAEVLLVQALPLPLALLSLRWAGRMGPLATISRILLAMRLGILAGTARAYPDRPITYWLSPLLDLPAAGALIAGTARGRHTWRGRVYDRSHDQEARTA